VVHNIQIHFVTVGAGEVLLLLVLTDSIRSSSSSGSIGIMVVVEDFL